MLYQILGWLSVAILVIVTAPYWLRTLNNWTIKTKDKRFLNFLKFLRKLHKPLGVVLAGIALWHAYLALGSLRLHTGLLVYLGILLTAVLGYLHHRKKDKRIFKGHKTMALISALLLVLHLLWPGAIWYLFKV